MASAPRRAFSIGSPKSSPMQTQLDQLELFDAHRRIAEAHQRYRRSPSPQRPQPRLVLPQQAGRLSPSPRLSPRMSGGAAAEMQRPVLPRLGLGTSSPGKQLQTQKKQNMTGGKKKGPSPRSPSSVSSSPSVSPARASPSAGCSLPELRSGNTERRQRPKSDAAVDAMIPPVDAAFRVSSDLLAVYRSRSLRLEQQTKEMSQFIQELRVVSTNADPVQAVSHLTARDHLLLSHLDMEGYFIAYREIDLFALQQLRKVMLLYGSSAGAVLDMLDQRISRTTADCLATIHALQRLLRKYIEESGQKHKEAAALMGPSGLLRPRPADQSPAGFHQVNLSTVSIDTFSHLFSDADGKANRPDFHFSFNRRRRRRRSSRGKDGGDGSGDGASDGATEEDDDSEEDAGVSRKKFMQLKVDLSTQKHIVRHYRDEHLRLETNLENANQAVRELQEVVRDLSAELELWRSRLPTVHQIQQTDADPRTFRSRSTQTANSMASLQIAERPEMVRPAANAPGASQASVAKRLSLQDYWLLLGVALKVFAMRQETRRASIGVSKKLQSFHLQSEGFLLHKKKKKRTTTTTSSSANAGAATQQGPDEYGRRRESSLGLRLAADSGESRAAAEFLAIQQDVGVTNPDSQSPSPLAPADRPASRAKSPPKSLQPATTAAVATRMKAVFRSNRGWRKQAKAAPETVEDVTGDAEKKEVLSMLGDLRPPGIEDGNASVSPREGTEGFPDGQQQQQQPEGDEQSAEELEEELAALSMRRRRRGGKSAVLSDASAAARNRRKSPSPPHK